MIGILPLLVVLVVVVVVASRRGSERHRPAVHDPGTPRRVGVVLVVLVAAVLFAIGLGGLVATLFEILGGGTRRTPEELAAPWAFTVVGAPFFFGLWWSMWHPAGGENRRSEPFALYLGVFTTAALIVGTTSSLTALDGVFVRRPVATSAGAALVWGALWVWHQWMSMRPDVGELASRRLVPLGGAVYGLAVTTYSGIRLLAGLIEVGARPDGRVELVGGSVWMPSLRFLPWLVVGAAIWWWHWSRRRCRDDDSPLANVAVVLTGSLGAAALADVGFAMVLFRTLRHLVGTDPSARFGPIGPLLGTPVALALVGSAVWAYHRPVLAARSATTREANRLALSGGGLGTLATGLGIVVSSALGAAAGSGKGMGELLLGGLSALVVGAATWWVAWRPDRLDRTREAAAFSGRRVYLGVVFGASTLTAFVTLVVITYQVFKVVLGGAKDGPLLDAVRTPVGLLVATGVAAAYHFPIWRSDRALLAELKEQRAIDTIVLVTGSDPAPLVSALSAATGAKVIVWTRMQPEPGGPTPEGVCAAVAGTVAPRALVLTRGDGSVEVIPLGA